MTLRWGGRTAIALSMGLGAFGCTRGNPSFGDGGADGTDSAATEATSAGSLTGATDSASGGSQTSADTGGEDNGGSGGEGVCGDGVVDDGEECDKGEDENSNVGVCKLDCTLNVCGDGFVGPAEACDQPEDVAEEFCTHDCKSPTCGNGMVDRTEECDSSAGGMGPSDCTPICTVNVCGDTFHQGGEECDDGNLDTTDACIDCALAFCGDGFINELDEECEGNIPVLLTCMDLGFFAGMPGCANCQVSAEGCHNCGDGEVQEDEQCDPADPNGPPADVGQCQATPGWMGPGTIMCSETCVIATEGGCCKLNGQPCNPDIGTNVFCCSQFCDPNGICGG